MRVVLPGEGTRRRQLNLLGDMELIYVLVVPRVQQVLCDSLGKDGLTAQQLARHFELVDNAVHKKYSREEMERTTLREAFGGASGVLRVHPVSQAGAQASSSEEFFYSPGFGVSSASGACDRVVVVRLRASHDPLKSQRHGPRNAVGNVGSGNFGSPVFLVKNYRKDRGESLMREIGVSVNQGRLGVNAGVFVQHHSTVPGQGSVGNPNDVHKHAEAVLQLCMGLDVVKKDVKALDALKNRQSFDSNAAAHRTHPALPGGHGYGWTAPIGLAYPIGSTLHHHIDGHGRWVVLFSFGLTCDFHAAGRTITIESGDALVFNGGGAHAVMHGLDKVWSQPSLAGVTKALPAGMLDKLANTRISVQVRQI